MLLCVSGSAYAQTRAWLDRDRIALGETTTLNVETDGGGEPDWTPLARDFELSGHTSRRHVSIRNGRQVANALFGVALQPRREGVLRVPSLQVGNARTAPLSVRVGPPTARAARDGAPAFIEAEVDVQAPYVQQSVGYVLRLFYATPLVSGSLEQPAPDGASLQRIGNDVQYSRDIDGRRYTVVERRFQLVPERSGVLTIPGARFEGRGVGGGMFDNVFNRGPREISANGPPSVVEVQAMPAGAPQPWLPLYGVQARWLEAPVDGQAGEASTFVLEAEFDGAVGTQLPELALPPIAGAQVFAEPPQYDERFEDGRPQVRLTRRYAVVPRAAGTLAVTGPRIAWWDVRAATARSIAAPPVSLVVAAGDAVTPGTEVPSAANRQTAISSSGERPAAPGPWPALAALFAALWLLTAAWAWRLRQRGAVASPSAIAVRAGEGAASGRVGSGQAHRQLMHLLQTGTPVEVESALRHLRTPPAASLDALVAALDTVAQRGAVEQWQRARWQDGDLAAARQALRDAFRTRSASQATSMPSGDDALPPLYPPRG